MAANSKPGKAAHLVRPSSGQEKGQKTGAVRKVQQPVVPEKVYPPGYFTEPVRAWVSMAFESRWPADKDALGRPLVRPVRPTRPAQDVAIGQRNTGYDRHSLHLPGALPRLSTRKA